MSKPIIRAKRNGSTIAYFFYRDKNRLDWSYWSVDLDYLMNYLCHNEWRFNK